MCDRVINHRSQTKNSDGFPYYDILVLAEGLAEDALDSAKRVIIDLIPNWKATARVGDMRYPEQWKQQGARCDR
jgi:hypothetical protein